MSDKKFVNMTIKTAKSDGSKYLRGWCGFSAFVHADAVFSRVELEYRHEFRKAEEPQHEAAQLYVTDWLGILDRLSPHLLESVVERFPLRVRAAFLEKPNNIRVQFHRCAHTLASARKRAVSKPSYRSYGGTRITPSHPARHAGQDGPVPFVLHGRGGESASSIQSEI